MYYVHACFRRLAAKVNRKVKFQTMQWPLNWRLVHQGNRITFQIARLIRSFTVRPADLWHTRPWIPELSNDLLAADARVQLARGCVTHDEAWWAGGDRYHRAGRAGNSVHEVTRKRSGNRNKSGYRLEKRKLNIVIHGVPETDAEHDIESVAEIIIGEGLHMDFKRQEGKMMRIGRLTEGGRPRPLRVSLKTIDGKKGMLARAKSLKNKETCTRIISSPDLTRKQQRRVTYKLPFLRSTCDSRRHQTTWTA